MGKQTSRIPLFCQKAWKQVEDIREQELAQLLDTSISDNYMHHPLTVEIFFFKKKLHFKPGQSMHIFKIIPQKKQSTLNIHNNQQDNTRICKNGWCWII